MQVTDRGPDALQFVTHFFERYHQGCEIPGGFVGQQGREFLPVFCDKLLDRRYGMLRFDEIESRQSRGIEKRVWHENLVQVNTRQDTNIAPCAGLRNRSWGSSNVGL